jgi:deoxyxylulose-5-phosphate synthase
MRKLRLLLNRGLKLGIQKSSAFIYSGLMHRAKPRVRLDCCVSQQPISVVCLVHGLHQRRGRTGREIRVSMILTRNIVSAALQE